MQCNVRAVASCTGLHQAALVRQTAVMKLMIAVPTLASIAFVILSGCTKDPTPSVSAAVADIVPTWLGGMPSDVPPRRETPEYDAWQQRRYEEASRPKDKK